MSDLKNIPMIDFLGQMSHWGRWPEKMLAKAKRRGYEKLLTRKETVPIFQKYKNSVAKNDETRNVE